MIQVQTVLSEEVFSLISLIGQTLQPEESPTYIETWKEMEKLIANGNNQKDLLTDVQLTVTLIQALQRRLGSRTSVSRLSKHFSITPILSQQSIRWRCTLRSRNMTFLNSATNSAYCSPLIPLLGRTSMLQILQS